MNDNIEWIKPNLGKFVNYERDGYEFARLQDFPIPWLWEYTDSGDADCFCKKVYECYASIPLIQALEAYESKQPRQEVTQIDLRPKFVCWVMPDEHAMFGKAHRDDGPAKIKFDINGRKLSTEWWIRGKDISREVRPWIIDMGLPPFYNWKDEHKMLFKLAFS